MNLKRLAVLGAVVAFFAASPAWASLGVHAVDTTNPCKKCHDTAVGVATLRGWAGGSLPDTSGTGWAGRQLSSLCYMCHTSGGGGFTATNQSANAYVGTAHSNTVSEVPDGPDFSADATMATSNLPYVTKVNMECTSCHNVHKYEDKPFIQRPAVATLCTACHKGRVNSAPLRGSLNTFAGTRAFSTHPTAIAIASTARASVKTLADPGTAPGVNVPYTSSGAYALGGHRVATANAASATAGNMDCGTCHAVHGVRQGLAPATALLAINNTTGTGGSALCNYCHNGGVGAGNVGLLNGATDHPIDDSTGTAFYPTGTVMPTLWNGQRSGESASPASFFTTGVTGTPACSSCHDMHGGIATTALLQWPQASADNTFSYNTWCWVCHTAAQIAPRGHHSVTFNWASSQIICGDCHGAGAAGWTAHNGFWAWPTPAPAVGNSGFCEGCHTASDPTFLIAAGIKGNKALVSAAVRMPSKHGTERSPYASSEAGSSHQVNLAANVTNVNLVKKTTAWTGSGGISEWGAGVNTPICESCHNIIVNGAGSVAATTTSGWLANLLLQAYEDDLPGVAQTGSAVNDQLCRGCHTNGGTGFVHGPEAHTVAAYTFTAANVPYGARTTMTILTAPTGTCPNVSTADATGSPNTLSYPAANVVNCDSCHRPHNADADSLDVNRYLILENTAASAWGTTICAECHNTDTQCQ